ncbi:MAG: SPFH/Band 7/PHB domain protein [Alphaproteobacteria bacterium]|nr:SPFH/Band 7/PHB domain protein [Alphaproteobacteria bacterium]
MTILFVLISFLLLLLTFAFLAVVVVPQGYNYTVERLGRYIKTLHSGLSFIIPFVDRVGRKVNMMERVVDMQKQEVITRDNVIVTVDGIVFFRVMDAPKASYEVDELDLSILNLATTSTRTVMGSMDLDDLLSQRDEINKRLLSAVDIATSPWGIKVTRIEIRDIDLPTDLLESMARQMKAERDRRASILCAEGDKQSIVLNAEGRKHAAFLDAEARERSAQAEAASVTLVNKAVCGDTRALNYFVAQKYIEAFGKLASAPNQKVLMLPVESASIMGAIGGIAEIARGVFNENKETAVGLVEKDESLEISDVCVTPQNKKK